MKIVKNIYSTDIYDDTELMPNKNKIILGINSFWILNLITISYYKELYFLTTNLFLISIASPIYWYNYKINSIFHKLDKYSVISCFIYLFINESFYKILFNLFFIIPSYLLSSILCINKNYNLQLYLHLLFRYFTFVLLYNYIDNNNDNNYIFLIKIEYILYNIYLCNNTYNSDKKLLTYLKHSIELITIVGCNDYLYYYLKNDKYNKILL